MGSSATMLRDYLVDALPLTNISSPAGRRQVADPPPAFLHLALGRKDLVEPLGPALVVHQRAVRLGECAGRQYDVGPRAGRILKMVDHDHLPGPVEAADPPGPARHAATDRSPAAPACRPRHGRAVRRPPRGSRRPAVPRPEAVAFRERQHELRVATVRAQGPRHVGRRLQHPKACGARARHDQRMLAFAQGPPRFARPAPIPPRTDRAPAEVRAPSRAATAWPSRAIDWGPPRKVCVATSSNEVARRRGHIERPPVLLDRPAPLRRRPTARDAQALGLLDLGGKAGLAQGQRQHRRRVRHVFAKHQRRVACSHVGERRAARTAAPEDCDRLAASVVARPSARPAREPLRPDQPCATRSSLPARARGEPMPSTRCPSPTASADLRQRLLLRGRPQRLTAARLARRAAAVARDR